MESHNLTSEYEKYLYSKGRSISTIESYIRAINEFCRFVNKDIAKIKQKDIEDYKMHLRNINLNGKKLSTKTINLKLIAISQYLKFLSKEKNIYIKVNIEPIKIQKIKYLETVIINEEEFYKLINTARKYKDKRAEAIFYTLFLTGMRVSELLQLKIDDIYNSEIKIIGKGNKERAIFIPDKLKEIINEYINTQRKNTSDKIFTGIRGGLRRQTINRIIKKYCELADIDKKKGHAHAFRHLYAFVGIKEGRPISDIADELGHSSLDTTRIYTRKPKEEKYRELNEYLNSKVK